MWVRLHLQDVWDIYKISESTRLAVEAPHPAPNSDDDVTASESHQAIQLEFLLRWGLGRVGPPWQSKLPCPHPAPLNLSNPAHLLGRALLALTHLLWLYLQVQKHQRHHE